MSKRIIILGVAVLAAGAAGYLALNMQAPQQSAQNIQKKQAPAVAVDEVLVASENIRTGDKITSGSLRWQKWPVDAISPDFVTISSRPSAVADLKGAIVRSAFVKGEPIRTIKILGSDQSFMSSILPAGKRAVATKVTADTSAGGFILPDDYVDVIMTTRDQKTGKFRTATVLSNIRVLAIDQTIRENERGEQVQVGQTATLELTPKQTEIISAAHEMADSLTLALRSVRDIKSGRSEPSADYLVNGGKDGGGITVIKDGKVSEVSTQ